MLDDVARLLPDAHAKASSDAFADWKCQFDLNDEILIFRAIGYLNSYHDFKRSDEGGSDNDWSFIVDRMEARAERDAEEGRWIPVKLLMDHDGGTRGELVEMPNAEAEWMLWKHAASWPTDADFVDPVAVPSVGDSLRVASLLHGV